MIHECIKCKEDFLTEADPFIVFPKPSGSEFQCLRCYQQREAKLVEALKFYSSYYDYDYWQPTGHRETATHTSKIHRDSGEKAREALKELGVEL